MTDENQCPDCQAAYEAWMKYYQEQAAQGRMVDPAPGAFRCEKHQDS